MTATEIPNREGKGLLLWCSGSFLKHTGWGWPGAEGLGCFLFYGTFGENQMGSGKVLRLGPFWTKYVTLVCVGLFLKGRECYSLSASLDLSEMCVPVKCDWKETWAS